MEHPKLYNQPANLFFSCQFHDQFCAGILIRALKTIMFKMSRANESHELDRCKALRRELVNNFQVRKVALGHHGKIWRMVEMQTNS